VPLASSGDPPVDRTPNRRGRRRDGVVHGASTCAVAGDPESDGFTSRELFRLLGIAAREGLSGIEVVKVPPPYDVAEITALLGTRVSYTELGTLVEAGKLGMRPGPGESTESEAEAFPNPGDTGAAYGRRDHSGCWDEGLRRRYAWRKDPMEASQRGAQAQLEWRDFGQGAAPERGALAPSRIGLTRHEQEVLGLLSLRMTDPEIGRQLFIGTRTVETHVANILGKLGAANRREAAALAIRFGLAS
jgi:DNA-binding CsgD family transcriptional regulator